jgi:hypothetical protein
VTIDPGLVQGFVECTIYDPIHDAFWTAQAISKIVSRLDNRGISVVIECAEKV